jgi:hypothetical protein
MEEPCWKEIRPHLGRSHLRRWRLCCCGCSRRSACSCRRSAPRTRSRHRLVGIAVPAEQNQVARRPPDAPAQRRRSLRHRGQHLRPMRRCTGTDHLGLGRFLARDRRLCARRNRRHGRWRDRLTCTPMATYRWTPATRNSPAARPARFRDGHRRRRNSRSTTTTILFSGSARTPWPRPSSTP